MSKSTVWRTYRHKTSAFYLLPHSTHTYATQNRCCQVLTWHERDKLMFVRLRELWNKKQKKHFRFWFHAAGNEDRPICAISARKLTFGPKNTSQESRKLSHTSRQNRHNWYFKMTTSFFSFLTIVHSDRLTGAVRSDITGSGGRCGRLLLYHYYPLPWRS